MERVHLLRVDFDGDVGGGVAWMMGRGAAAEAGDSLEAFLEISDMGGALVGWLVLIEGASSYVGRVPTGGASCDSPGSASGRTPVLEIPRYYRSPGSLST